jgi:hypothetical protein
MKIVACFYCGVKTKKYDREGDIFCDRKCYTEWKRENPNKKPY